MVALERLRIVVEGALQLRRHYPTVVERGCLQRHPTVVVMVEGAAVVVLAIAVVVIVVQEMPQERHRRWLPSRGLSC